MTGMADPTAKLFGWLRDEALPLWSTVGVDRANGGFVERIEPDGRLNADVRRARLVARQIYVFRTAYELGWNGPCLDLVQHGLTALREHHIGADDVVIPRYTPASGASEGGFDLYDQAFALFGLGHAAALGATDELEEQAGRILTRMREGWQHDAGGFAESKPATAPLKANPHMHLLEAALAWSEVTGAAAWRELASEVAQLCVRRFLEPDTGALHEYFDTRWHIEDAGEQQVVEPGHQAEWAWLLMRWSAMSREKGVEQPAHRLFEIAEGPGLNARQARLINELDGALAPKWSWMRLWPQTERIKALVLFAENAPTAAIRTDLERRLDQAVTGLLDFFDHPIAGSWWEHLAEDGQPVPEAARASSLYHIMGAAAELGRFTARTLG